MAPSEADAKRAVAALQAVPADALPERILTTADTAVAARMIRRESAREERLERLRDPGSLRCVGPGKYVVLVVDPPWRYTGASDPTRTAENHYPTLSHDELLALPVGEIAARHAVLFLWTTPPKVAEAAELIAAWGFAYKTCAVWDKERLGLGSWYRLQHELLLIATRGNVPPPAPMNRPPSVIHAPRGAHSAKPATVREQIERMYPHVPRIELFARGAVPGWEVWGFEAVREEAGLQVG
ncbi:MAG TPA: MT-A70 family methyltransferase [Gemmatimonadaceae bacterium]|nr:MT-A70 family methyltransferase [Gemmatimonadaceae bacterium]